ncbi:MAG: alpha/beta hydrolase [Bacteroidetes bacterium]|nr:alpha/beta hydrolase [Bacteroidota bacterium]
MFIEIKGKQINYEIINEQLLDNNASVLIFLHEGLGSIKQWKDIPESISNACGLAAIVYDRYGYGNSSAREENITTEYLHDEALIYLPELLSKLGIQKNVLLIGHSDGASIALIFAATFPTMLTGVISLAAHVFVEDITISSVGELVKKYNSNEKLSALLRKYHREKTDKIFKDWSGMWLSADFRNWDIEKLLTNIRVPVIAIQGENDEHGSIKQLNAIKNKINAEVTTYIIADCGHVPHLEKKEEIKTIMINFINSLKIK